MSRDRGVGRFTDQSDFSRRFPQTKARDRISSITPVMQRSQPRQFAGLREIIMTGPIPVAFPMSDGFQRS